jgi:zinc/manganese transport system substrate-binding protein
VVALATALALAACGDGDAGEATAELRIVATTTILGDVARNVAGDDAAVEVLLPVGADPHDYQPSSQQVAAIQRADLVIANGLGLEEGLEDVLDSAARDGAAVLEIAPLLDPLPFGGEDDDADHGDGGLDPHVWLDPQRMVEAARQIATELEAIGPDRDWGARAERYAGQLAAADRQIEELLAVIPPEDRKLITNHDALEYFAGRYGFQIIGSVIPGGSTLGDPSSGELADLVEVMRSEGLRAIFAETTESATLAAALADEVGGDVRVVDLYTGSLGEPGSGAETLIDMLVTNARLIAGALAPLAS